MFHFLSDHLLLNRSRAHIFRTLPPGWGSKQKTAFGFTGKQLHFFSSGFDPAVIRVLFSTKLFFQKWLFGLFNGSIQDVVV
jgi:hypothetical protein